MAYARLADEPHDFIATTPRPAGGRGIFRRAFEAMVEARRQGAEREIAEFLRGRGGALTDEAEREIDRVLTSSGRL
jgi:hypothetical protein